jgi:hypothetical protein
MRGVRPPASSHTVVVVERLSRDADHLRRRGEVDRIFLANERATEKNHPPTRARDRSIDRSTRRRDRRGVAIEP